jgi:hypothetical protein
LQPSGERKKAAAAPVAKMFNFAHEVLLARLLLLRRWQRKIKAVSAKRQKAAAAECISIMRSATLCNSFAENAPP